MIYTTTEIAIILDTCKSIEDVKKTTFQIRKLMFLENKLQSISFLRLASILKVNKLIQC